MTSKAKYLFIGFAVLAVAAMLVPVAACGEDSEPTPLPPINWNGLGEEQLCTVITNPEADEILLDYEGFAVSFNPTLHLPNWVAWTITARKMENSDEPRHDNFRPDESVEGCATLADYYKSGYDRGHMAPSGDMKWSYEAMDQACYLTNICPQVHALNNGAWKNLEEKCRKNATRDSLLVVVCGPVLNKGFSKYIGETPIPVPDRFFKVILTPGGVAGPQAIGFLMPNDYVEGGMQATATTVDAIEELTGHDFFSLLPDELETVLESEVDFNRFSTGRPSRRNSRH